MLHMGHVVKIVVLFAVLTGLCTGAGLATARTASANSGDESAQLRRIADVLERMARKGCR